jgi:hypothetical protein
MALKPFNELRKIDVKPFCKTRKAKDENNRAIDVAYLPWGKCIDLLHENGAEKVYYTPVAGENGSSLIMSGAEFADKSGTINRCYETAIDVVIDDLKFRIQGPIMNGSNPVKDNSLTQQRLHNAQTRLFVKGVAFHTGLGVGLWIDGDEDESLPGDDIAIHNIYEIKRRVEETLSAKLRHKDYKEILSALKISERQHKTIMGYYDTLAKFEKALSGV